MELLLQEQLIKGGEVSARICMCRGGGVGSLEGLTLRIWRVLMWFLLKLALELLFQEQPIKVQQLQ